MFRYIIRFSLDNAALVVTASAVFILASMAMLRQMPVDVFPELNAPTVVILTEAGGFAADEVEQFITFPVETAVNGLPGVRRVRSSSAMSLSIVWVEFDWGIDIYRARQLVAERLAAAKEALPEGVHSEMAPVSSITGEIMLLSLLSTDGKLSGMELRAFAEYELRKQLLAVPGVSQVVAIGGELPEYQIQIDQSQLLLNQLTVQDLVDAAQRAHSTAGAGYLPNLKGLEIPMRQTGRVQSVEDIRDAIVKYTPEGVPITIGQVANVVVAGAPKRGTAAEGGRPAVILSVQKAPGVNTLALTDAIDRALDQFQSAVPPGVTLNRHVFRQADFIHIALENVIHVSRDAAIFVCVILAIFLMNLRTTLISLLALPLSVALTLVVMWGLGMSINVMTLGGLAVAIGALVDDAIIDVENVFRRLRENHALQPGSRRPHTEVVFAASNEIRSSIVFATIIIVMVFIPLLFLQGLEGRFFRPLGVTYILSLLASLLVALTLTPALCLLLLRKISHRAEQEGAVVRWLKAVYAPVLRWSLRRRLLTLALAGVATLASLGLARTFGTSFLPEFNEGTYTVFLMAPPGTSLEESDRLAKGVESRLVRLPQVRAVARRTGRAERDEHAEPVSSSEIEVSVNPGLSPREIQAFLRQVDDILGDIPGITTTVGQPIQHRLSHILSGTPAGIAINVFGDDLALLRQVAKEIETALLALPGARDVAANREVTIQTLPIRYRLHDLARWGLAPADAAEQVQAAFFGAKVATVNQGTRLYDMVVRLRPEERHDIEDVRSFLLQGRSGAHVRLEEVADIGPEQASNLIARENARRKATVSCNVAQGYNLGHLVAQVQQAVDPIARRNGVTVHYGGQFEAQQSASRSIYLMGAGVIVVMLVLLQMALHSLRSAVLVMLNLPLALIGGVVAVFLTEGTNPLGNLFALFGGGGRYQAPVLSIASLVGFVTLFGVAVRNGILLVNHYQRLQEVEGKPLYEAVFQGSMERLSPILMTALCAMLGLVPLAWAAGRPGSELLAPLATVVLGGLATSTLLNLVVVPAGYLLTHAEKPSNKTDLPSPEEKED